MTLGDIVSRARTAADIASIERYNTSDITFSPVVRSYWAEVFEKTLSELYGDDELIYDDEA